MTDALDPTPGWPADTLATLTGAQHVPVHHRVSLRVNSSVTADPAGTLAEFTTTTAAVLVEHDAGSRPLARAQITMPTLGPINPDHLTVWGVRVIVHADYEPLAATPHPSKHVFYGWAETITVHADYVTIDAVSTDSRPDCANWQTAPRPLTTVSGWDHLSQLLYQWSSGRVRILEDETRPLIGGAAELATLRALVLNPGDNWLDFAATAADTWPAAEFALQGSDVIGETPSHDVLDTVMLRTRAPLDLTRALDLRAGHGIALEPPIITHNPADFANRIVVRTTWTKSDGTTSTTTAIQDDSGAAPSIYLPPGRPIVQLTIDRQRVAGSTAQQMATASRLLSRTTARTWTAAIECRPLFWVRPGMSARVTDDRAGIISAVRHTLPGLTTITVRPY